MNQFRDIIFRLFDKIPILSDWAVEKHKEYAISYLDTKDINFTAIFANKLASLATTESNVNIVGDNRRSEILDEMLQRMWDKSKGITAQALGTGGVILLPYSSGGKIYTDIVSQDRFAINSMAGDDIKEATILADMTERNRIRYYRYTDYSIDGNTYIIRNKATRDSSPVPLDSVPEWAGIEEEIRIANVDRVLFAYLRCPIDNRNNDISYGVPITYGSEKIISEIMDCLQQINLEYKRKQVFVGMDSQLLRRPKNSDKEQPPSSGLFKLLESDDEGKNFWQIFDPAIRDSSYYNRLSNLFELLEKSVGVSKGVLTEPVTSGATATEIKRATYDTYAMIESIRHQWQKAIDHLVYAYDVLANYYSLSPAGDYQIRYDWDYSLIESSQESWQQMKDGQSMGIVKKAEARQYLFPGETIDESQSVIDEITENEPNLSVLIGDE